MSAVSNMSLTATGIPFSAPEVGELSTSRAAVRAASGEINCQAPMLDSRSAILPRHASTKLCELRRPAAISFRASSAVNSLGFKADPFGPECRLTCFLSKIDWYVESNLRHRFDKTLREQLILQKQTFEIINKSEPRADQIWWHFKTLWTKLNIKTKYCPYKNIQHRGRNL